MLGIESLLAMFSTQVFQLPESVTPTSWILDTHYDFLERRFQINIFGCKGSKTIFYKQISKELNKTVMFQIWGLGGRAGK